MSNRILAILILMGFGGAIYGFYLYFYVYYKGNLEIETNLSAYSVSLYGESVKRTFTQQCGSETCLFIGLPPVEYELRASATGFIDIQTNVSIPKSDMGLLNLSFERLIELMPVNDIFKPALTPAEKVKHITTKKLYKLIDNEAGVYFITKNSTSIEIRSETDVIGILDFNGGKGDISIQRVLGSDDMVWMKIGDTNYIYNTTYKQLSPINLDDIRYMKVFGEYGVLVLDTAEVFEYTPNTGALTRQESLDDFIVYEDALIYLVQDRSKSVIKTDDKILLTSNTRLSKIYLENNIIYLEDEKGNRMRLEGME